VRIYRHDPADEEKGTAINVDRYFVWERIPINRDLRTMVNTASTEINANMVGFLADHAFMVKEAPGPDHWLAELPPEVFAVVRRAV